VSRRDLRQDVARLSRAVYSGTISLEDAALVLHLTPRATTVRLRYLIKKGFAQRLRRGLYQIVPQRETRRRALPASGDLDLVQSLFGPCYIGGWTAAEEYGLPCPITDELFVVTAARVRRCRVVIGGVEIRLTHVPRRLVDGPGIERRPRKPGISNLERTIVDGLVNPAWLGGVGNLTGALSGYFTEKEEDLEPLVDLLQTVGSGAGLKRLGFLLSHRRMLDANLQDRLYRLRTKGVVYLEPGGLKRGKVDRFWRVCVNCPPIDPLDRGWAKYWANEPDDDSDEDSDDDSDRHGELDEPNEYGEYLV
jgi:predicted transcriptional regulator of viral defense system